LPDDGSARNDGESRVGEVSRHVREKLWRGGDPFAGLQDGPGAVDEQGWNSHHPYLSEAIATQRPGVVVEVGVWKGRSTLFMANRMRDLGLDAVVIAVDTWLGAVDHWRDDALFRELNFDHGYPRLYDTFAANVVRHGLQDYVVPLPLDSVNARAVVSYFKVEADVVHIDAGHDYRSVATDLREWWGVLRPGGLFIGDDYHDDGVRWPRVRRAIDDFLARTPHAAFEHRDGKCRAVKV
jgi:SAM-dependent methyltransferase